MFRFLVSGFLLSGGLVVFATGCCAIPQVAHKPQYRNPFPQLHRVAVLPFYNQSEDPFVNQDNVALAYYHELQQIPGFEVMPLGVVKRTMEAYRSDPQSGLEFQELARETPVPWKASVGVCVC